MSTVYDTTVKTITISIEDFIQLSEIGYLFVEPIEHGEKILIRTG